MRYAITLLIFALVAKLGHSSKCTMTSPCSPLKGGLPFQKPEELMPSADGSETLVLRVSVSEFTLDWLKVHRRLYNGKFPGPILRWKPGDIIKLKLVNALGEPDFREGAEGSLRFPNTTNLHTHGLHISSKKPQDNVLIEIQPSNSYSYEYQVHSDQPAGTYFYHPHVHGSAYFQNLGGMAGMLIIEDDPQKMPSELEAVSCPNHCDEDIPIVFQLFQYDSSKTGSFSVAQKETHDYEHFRLNNVFINDTSTLEQWLEEPSNGIHYMLVNGQLQPVLNITAGEMRRFRLLNAAGLDALAVEIAPSGSSTCTVKEIALDGHYLNKPRDLRLGKSFLAAGARVDWLVACESPGEYKLRSVFDKNVDQKSVGNLPLFSGDLLTIRVQGESQSVASFPNKLPEKPHFMQDLQNVDCDKVGGRFAVEITPKNTLNRESFSEKSIRYKAEVGTVQEWYLTSSNLKHSHPIHLHINAFQVISYNDYIGPYGVSDENGNWKLFSQKGKSCQWQHSGHNENVPMATPPNTKTHIDHEKFQVRGGVGTIGYAQVGEWRDTILVPPLSNITIRFRTDEYTGIVFVHCHLLIDADRGMSMLTEIVGKGASLKANVTSGKAYPGSCMVNQPLLQSVRCRASIIAYSLLMIFGSFLTQTFIQTMA